MHSFTTDRLLIRPLAEQDRAIYVSLYSDEKIMQHIGKAFSQQTAEKAFHNTLKAMQKSKRVFDKIGFIFDANVQPENTDDCYRYFDKEKWQQTLACQIL